MGHYFNGSFPALLKRMDDHLVRARKTFAPQLKPRDALILGGGYGRGEGGVHLSSGDPELYNDLDYFLFTESPDSSALIRLVKRFERIESEALGIDVEVTCLHPDKLAGARTSMMFHDLVMGHRVVVGAEDYLAAWQGKMSPELIAPIEATRLLWNRGSGLLYARCELGEANARSFIYRQHMKLALALGDALLCMAGQHNAFCTTRRERFAQLDAPLATEEIRALHAKGVDFKQRPHEPPATLDLAAQNEQLRALWTDVYLSVESERIGYKFSRTTAYTKYPNRLFPDKSPYRCLLLALRDKVKRGAALRPALDYPRGALMRALLELNSPAPNWAQVKKHLPVIKCELKSTSKVYETWWHYYS